VPLVPLADGVWVDTDPVSIVGTSLTATMTVLQLGGDQLLLHSPISLTEERRAEVEKLGTVAHLLAPNLFHHRWLGDWAAAYPTARVHVAPGLVAKRPDLPRKNVLGAQAEPAFAGVVALEPIVGCRLGETAVYYEPSRTLVVADLVHNVGTPAGAWTRFYTRSMGFYDRVALSRALRWTAFADRVAARTHIDRLLALDFERLVVGHGTPLRVGAKDALAAAYTWLR
jgi:hypothetical protein